MKRKIKNPVFYRKDFENSMVGYQEDYVKTLQRENRMMRQERQKLRRDLRDWKILSAASLACAVIVILLAVTALEGRASAADMEQPVEARTVPQLIFEEPVQAATEQPAGAAQMRFERIIENATITAYCICKDCCGKEDTHPAYGITASGREAVPYYSVAVDPLLIELGTTLYLDFGGGTLMECRADDTGSGVSGAHIDLCLPDHQSALEFGVQTAKVYVEVKNE